MKSLTYKFISISLFASVLLLLSGCGSSDGSSTVTGVAVTASTVSGNGYTPGSQQWCQDGNLEYVAYSPYSGDIASGEPAAPWGPGFRCTRTVLGNGQFVAPFPQVQASSGFGNGSNHNFFVYSDEILDTDLIYFSITNSPTYSASGCPGALGTTSYTADFTGMVTSAGPAQNQVLYNGVQPDGSSSPVPAGLEFEIGSHMYTLKSGNYISVGTSSSGASIIGFNSPCTNNSFTNVQGLIFIHQHCEDSATATTQECPQDYSTN